MRLIRFYYMVQNSRTKLLLIEHLLPPAQLFTRKAIKAGIFPQLSAAQIEER